MLKISFVRVISVLSLRKLEAQYIILSLLSHLDFIRFQSCVAPTAVITSYNLSSLAVLSMYSPILASLAFPKIHHSSSIPQDSFICVSRAYAVGFYAASIILSYI